MTTKTNWFDSIEKTISNFDFDDIHEYMKNNDWKWFLSDGHHVPEVLDMIETAFSLLHECQSNYNGEEYWVETGGFKATVSEIGQFNLSFNKKY